MAGEYKVRTGSVSAPCADGGISQATEGGGDEGHGDRAGSGGSKGRPKWVGHWRNRSAREGGARWWWIGVA